MTLQPGSLKTIAEIKAWIYACDARVALQREHNEAVEKMVDAYQRAVQDKIDKLHEKIDATNKALETSGAHLDSLKGMLNKAVAIAWLGGVIVGVVVTVASAYISRG